MPGYPSNPDAPIKESDYRGRNVREISFTDPSLRLGRFRALDYFGDGSFYLLDAPGVSPCLPIYIIPTPHPLGISAMKVYSLLRLIRNGKTACNRSFMCALPYYHVPRHLHIPWRRLLSPRGRVSPYTVPPFAERYLTLPASVYATKHMPRLPFHPHSSVI